MSIQGLIQDFLLGGGNHIFEKIFGYFRTAEQTNSVIVIPWVVGVYQNKCPCHEGAARVTRAQPVSRGRSPSAGAFIPIFPVSNHGITILYPD